MTWLKGHWQLLALTALVLALWNTPLILPLKILTVFLHELSHGLAAILTGGETVSLSLAPDQGGAALTRGGSRFAILSAGYLGSLILGVAILFAGLKSTADRAVSAALGIVMLAVTALYLRGAFPMAFGAATGAALLAMARFLPHQVNDLTLRLIGLTSILYVPRDIFSDTIARSHLRSDAHMLADYAGGSTAIWGGLWLILSGAIIYLCLRHGLGRSSNIAWPDPP